MRNLSRRRPERPARGIVALAIALTIAAAACGGGGGTTHEVDPANVPDIPTIGDAVIATATVSTVDVFAEADEDADRIHSLENPWLLNGEADKPVDQVFLVEEEQGDWVKVLLPERPNGSTGWIKSADVELQTTPYRIDIQLGARLILVYEGNEVILREQVAIGMADAPTPPGEYYVRVLLESTGDSVYGPYAYGLSAHSETLTEFNGGDAEVGIHGNDDAGVLGQPVTSGCIRMSNEGITMLKDLLPLGTPVEIRA